MKCLASMVVLGVLVGCAGTEVDSESQVVVAQRISLAKRTGERSMGLQVSPGINIDDFVTTRADDVGCRKLDFVGPNGEPGVDNNLTFLFEAVEDLFEAGTVEALIQEAIREGRLLLMFRVSGVESFDNDSDVRVHVFSGEGAVHSSSGLLVADQTFDVQMDAPIADVKGRIRDGVLEAGPFDVTIPVAILNVFFDLTVRDAKMRAVIDGDGHWSAVIGGAVAKQTIFDVAAMADAMQGDDITPVIEAFIPMWVDLDPDESGECQSISATLAVEAVNAFVYPDVVF